MNFAHLPALPSADAQGLVFVAVWTAICIFGMGFIASLQGRQ